ncbi:MAG: biotin/lipoyl-containing protein [Elusimicrobiaceae bacterium]
MNIKTLSEVSCWIKETDLTEVVYRKSGTGFELKTEEAVPQPNIPSCAYSVIPSPGVGIYRLAPKGKTANFKEGNSVGKGDSLGFVEIHNTEKIITAQDNGVLRVICVEDGAPVQYGQPLFFIEPN